jgi:hypothetical protein
MSEMTLKLSARKDVEVQDRFNLRKSAARQEKWGKLT